jgi:hypothetical protein
MTERPIPGKKKDSIPKWVADSPTFAEEVRRLWTNNPNKPTSGFRRLAEYKNTLLVAAKRVVKQTKALDSPSVKLARLVSLLKLISPIHQDLPRIERLLTSYTFLRPLIHLSGSRWVDAGLEKAARDLHLSLTVSPPPLASKPNHLADLKANLPSSRAIIPSLRATPEEAERFDAEGKASIAKEFWGDVWARRASPPDQNNARSSLLLNYPKKVNASLLTSPLLTTS